MDEGLLLLKRHLGVLTETARPAGAKPEQGNLESGASEGAVLHQFAMAGCATGVMPTASLAS